MDSLTVIDSIDGGYLTSERLQDERDHFVADITISLALSNSLAETRGEKIVEACRKSIVDCILTRRQPI